MPPFLPRKRLRSASPEAGPSQPSATDRGEAKSISAIPRKPTLFEDLDAGLRQRQTADQKKAVLEKLTASDDDDESSLSSLSDHEFEDVPNAKRQKVNAESDEEDEDIEFEDVETYAAPGPSAPPPSGDLELTLTKDTRVSITNPFGTKKGPSKIERQIRVSTHQVHVQMLMFHNAIRNAWLCDKEVQGILIKQLPSKVRERVEKWRRDSGLEIERKEELGGKGVGKGKAKSRRDRKEGPRSGRDWGAPAERLAEGQVNMSRGDPLFGLLGFLMSYWKQRFRITAPGLRKLGYMSLQRLDEEMKSFNNDEHDPELHGERIRDKNEFKECARTASGSRDVGSQLFTALLRGLGLEARLVANLQPVGVGWTKYEEATEKNPRKLKRPQTHHIENESSEDESHDESEILTQKPQIRKPVQQRNPKSNVSKPKPPKRKPRGSGHKDTPIDLSASEHSALESDDSVIDMTPAKKSFQPSKPYDGDLKHPHYWTEVLSPITNTYTPIDPIVLKCIGTGKESLERFETRGAKSDEARQVTTYIIAHSQDGTAKEVTTRYLKNHMWPGRTKGNRITIEKIPIHNRHGKVKRYEQYDWFKTVMSGYVRGSKQCPRTEIDDYEEATILKPVKPEKKVVEEGKETLQYYKSSPDFVLERHLRREEAIKPNAQHVKMFQISKKGETEGEAGTEEKVFLRKDVVKCKSMETWHKEGRAPISGEQPLKRAPYRAATTNRRRELAEAELASGGKVLQGLYSWDQTDWIIPPPIENGIIPKNSFGNIDLYVESMLPEGAVHIPMRGTVKICKKLEIDYAEAVTGFEFGHRMAVPVITGVVVAEENYEAVMEQWQKFEEERVRKEDEKRRKLAIGMWRKMLMGMRIIKRIKEDYGDEGGHEVDEINPWTSKKGIDKDSEAKRIAMEKRDEEMAGGFLPEGYDEEEVPAPRFFPTTHDADDESGGFVVEGHDEPSNPPIRQYPTPQSFQFSTKTNHAQRPDSEEMMEDSEPEAEAIPTKKRGRAPVSNKKATKATKPTPKPTARATRSARQPSSSMPRSRRKGKVRIEDSEDAEEDEESSLTEVESESESQVEEEPVVKGPKRGAGKRVAVQAAASTSTRNTPRRNAAKKSMTALKSHYFEHDEDEDE